MGTSGSVGDGTISFGLRLGAGRREDDIMTIGKVTG